MCAEITKLYNRIVAGELNKDQAAIMVKDLQNRLRGKRQESDNVPSEFYTYNEQYLKDHKVHGRQVILGVTYVSLAINEFFNNFPNDDCGGIHRLTFVKPIELTQGQKAEVFIEKETEGKGGFTVLYRHNLSEEWRETAVGSMQRGVEFKKENIEFDNLKKEMTQIQDFDFIYVNNPPVEIGDSYKVITEMYVTKNLVLARFDLAPTLQEKTHSYRIHPLIANSAFHAVGLLLNEPEGGDGFLPFGVKEITFRKTESLEKGWILVKVVRNSGEMIFFDVDVFDDANSSAVVRFIGFSMKRLRVPDNRTDLSLQNNTSKKSIDRENSEPATESGFLQKILAYLQGKLGQLIENHSRLADTGANLMDLGLESSQLVALANEIETEVEVELYPTLFFEYPNLWELSEFFAAEHREAFIKLFSKSLSPPSDSSQEVFYEKVFNISQERFAPSKANIHVLKEETNGDIAVIGMHGIFPGSLDLDGFWESICAKDDLMREVPPDHWSLQPWYDPDPSAPNKTYCKWGSFIDDVDKFDAAFFNISPREAVWMDPQLRLFLQCVYAIGEDAGYISRLRGSNTGVFTGVCFHDYASKIAELNLPVDPYMGTGNASTVLANRVSFALDLKGPSMAIDTACSSSLFALHYACQSLRNRESDMAFAGGVNLLLSSWHYRYFSSIGALSPTGRCHTFDEAADGYVPGECIAGVLLKPLRAAERDGDRIHAVIKGSAALHGGYTPSLTAPSVTGEENVILRAWENAGIAPETLSYIEAHGTGTKLGDPIEIKSLKNAFSRFTANERFCAIGSAKASIGHAEGAAGIAGLLKVILQMKHKQIPAMPRFRSLNPYIKLEKTPLYINRELEDWDTHPGVPRRAGVSSFGFSGAYAHAVVEEYQDNREALRMVINEGNPALVVLSAKNIERVRKQAARLAHMIEKQHMDNDNLADIAYTLQVGREAMEVRFAAIVSSIKETVNILKGFAEGNTEHENSYLGGEKKSKTGFAALAADDAMQDTIRKWIAQRKLNQLAELWVNGANVAWIDMYGYQKPRLISLPSYPFAGERYWVPEPVSQPVAEQIHASSITTHVNYPLSEDGSTEFVNDIVRTVLGLVDNAEIDPNRQLSDYGMDSITGIQLQGLIRNKTGVKLDGRQFFSEFTVQEIVRQVNAAKKEAGLTENSDNFQSAAWVADKKVNLELQISNFGFEQKIAPKSLLITGATGFLGAFLCKEILQESQATLYCLVRAKTVTEGMERIKANFKHFELWDPNYEQRLIPVLGELGLPKLGIKSKNYRKLCKEVEAIYHCGAAVNHVLNYQSLKKQNVEGTLSIIDFAGTDLIKPIHFISSAVVCFQSDKETLLTPHQLEQPLEDGRYLVNGYVQTKWVSEHHLLQAQAKGIPVTIFRCGEITGSSYNGNGIIEDMFHRFLRLFSELDVVPEWDDAVIEVCPIDYVCKSILSISKKQDCYGKIFHLVHPQPIKISDFFNFLMKMNANTKKVSFEYWAESCEKFVENMGESYTKTILAPNFKLHDNGHRLFEYYFYKMELETTNTRQALNGTGVTFPEINDDWWKLCTERLSHFNGFSHENGG